LALGKFPNAKSFEKILSNLFEDVKLIRRCEEDFVKKITNEENKRRSSLEFLRQRSS